MNYFERPYVPPLIDELHVEKIFFLKNIQVYEKINKVLIIEEPEFKIVKKINEDLIIKKDLEVKRIETIEEEIKRKFSRISMKSNHMIVNLKILLFWW